METMGLHPGVAPATFEPVRVVRAGQRLDVPGDLELEGGGDAGPIRRLPVDLPIGYHRLRTDLGEQLLLHPPGGCHLPPRLRTWGWTVQLYALRSPMSWGIGDLGDLRSLARGASLDGAGVVAISPTWAPNPGPHPEPSPYFPSTRRFHNPLHLRVPEIPGAGALADKVAPLAAQARALNADPRIDRSAVARLKVAALEAIWSSAGVRDADGATGRRLRAFRRQRGPALRRWATFAALSERLGPGWHSWPEPFRSPTSQAVERFASDHRERIEFHEWVQWLLDEQLSAVAGGGQVRLINDLPVGADPGGFDAWDWQEMLAGDASLGVPADPFNLAGQDWGMPPFIPHRLRACGHRPFIETVRAAMRHVGGLRIDHVLGLFRLWWVPRGRPPGDGAYVRYPTEELLAILAIESSRAEALVIGEDLGTVPRGVRPRLARARILGTRLLLFERRSPVAWPRRALAAITTHDLPTVAGVWTGADLDDQRRAGLEPDAGGLTRFRERLSAATGLGMGTDVQDLNVAAHAALASSRCVLVTATVEDALGQSRRPNIPGTVPPQRENWSMALPREVDELLGDPLLRRVAAALQR
jgi:4-alpha-glucanotransferase